MHVCMRSGTTMECRQCMNLRKTPAVWSAVDTLDSAKVSNHFPDPNVAFCSWSGAFLLGDPQCLWLLHLTMPDPKLPQQQQQQQVQGKSAMHSAGGAVGFRVS